MFTPRTIVVMTASALATLGCASLDPDNSPKISIRPITRVHHGADANAMYQTGRYFQGQIRYDKAIAAYQDALQANPKYADAHNGLAVIYSIQGKSELAEQEFKAALAAAPNAGYLHNNLGYHYLQSGRNDEALAEFKRAKELDPGNTRVAANLATVREKLGLPVDTDVAAQPPVPEKAPKIAAKPVEPQGVQAYTVQFQAPRADAWTEVRETTANIVVQTTPQAADNVPQLVPLSVDDAAVHAYAVSSVQSPARMEIAPPATSGIGTEQQSEPVPTKPILRASTEQTAQFSATAPGVWELRSPGERVATPETDSPGPGTALAPAGSIDEARPPAGLKETMARRVEISNGNGITGLAHRVAALLKPRGFERVRLTNHEPYGKVPSKIQYLASAERTAAQVNAALPGTLPLVQVSALDGKAAVRVVLGKDFPESGSSARSEESSLHDAGLSTLTKYRVEVSNGNGITGLARRIAESLKSSGVERARLTNHKPFGEVASHVEYVAGAEQAAKRVTAELPVRIPMTLVSALDRNMQVKVVLGKDFPRHTGFAEMKGAAGTQVAARMD